MRLELNDQKIGKLFPFCFGITTDLQVNVYGATLKKLLKGTGPYDLRSVAAVFRPQGLGYNYQALKDFQGQLIIFKLLDGENMLLRGQLEEFEGTEELIFLGSPWISNVADLKVNNLKFSDFSNFDALLDLLHVVQALEINNADLKLLLDRIHQQHDELQDTKQKMEEYALFPLQNPEPIVRIDMQGEVLLQNKAMERIDIISFRGATYSKPEFWKYIITEKLQNKKDEFLEFECNDKSYSLACRYIPEYNYYNLYGRDISVQSKQKRALEEAIKAERASAVAKDNFLTHMSHEIRTPLNGVIGMASQLEQSDLNDEQKFYLRTLNTAADSLLMIISDILDLGKIESGQVVLEKSIFSLSQVIDRAVEVLRYKLEEKGLVLHKHFAHNLHDFYLGDPFRLNQIVLNIIGNAIKFTDTGAVDIFTRLIADDSDKQVIQIIVKDTGVGIEKSFLENIYDRFSQEKISRARKVGGSGLGMTITRELVLLMNGSIVIDSQVKKGTTVTLEFTFPKSTRRELHQHDDYEKQYDLNLLQQKVILIVDDNQLNRIVAKAMLANNGIKTLDVGSGFEALEVCRESLPDVILMDLQMPELDGYQTTTQIRKEISSSIPIIALTANALRGEREKCLENGMNDYISKPFKVDQLLACLQQVFDASRHKN